MSPTGDPEGGTSPEQTSSPDILAEQLRAGLNELNRSASGLFLSGLSAGLDIGFGPFLMAVLLATAAGAWESPLIDLALANAYAVGFVFVVMGRSSLFTEHTTLAVLPVLDRRASLAQLGRLWGIVYVGNVLGGAAFAAIAVAAAPAFGIADVPAFAELAVKLTAHSTWGLLTASVLAGWLMGLLSWLVAAGQETISRVFFVWVVAVTIGFAGLPHCIAGNVEVLMGLLLVPELGVVQYLRFLSLATVGNAVGGAVFVALLKYSHVVRGGT